MRNWLRNVIISANVQCYNIIVVAGNFQEKSRLDLALLHGFGECVKRVYARIVNLAYSQYTKANARSEIRNQISQVHSIYPN